MCWHVCSRGSGSRCFRIGAAEAILGARERVVAALDFAQRFHMSDMQNTRQETSQSPQVEIDAPGASLSVDKLPSDRLPCACMYLVTYRFTCTHTYVL